MKKGWKIFYIICGIIAAIGIIFCIAGFSMGATTAMIRGSLPEGVALGPLTGDTFFGYASKEEVPDNTAADTEKEFQKIKAIDLQMDIGEVEIRVAEEGQQDITVSTSGVSSRLKLRYGVHDHVLKFNTGKGIRLGGMSAGTITIYIPREYQLDSAEFDIGAGTIYIEDINTEKLKIDVDEGEAQVDHFLADDAEMNCDVGSITAAGNAKKNINLECDMGEIEYTADGSENDYNYRIDMDLGSVEVGSYDFSGAEVEKEINNHASRNMNVDCDLGSITVSFEKSI